MSDINALSSFLQPPTNQVDLVHTLASFAVCIVMSFVLRQFYLRRSFSLSGKHHIGAILPVLSAVVFIVIVVVKTSLALSLGLVGALSIVRFRTPIKEPEELIYLFLAIALGLGYGSGHIQLTTILATLTLLMVFFWLSNKKVSPGGEYNLVLTWPEGELSMGAVTETLGSLVESLKLIRFESGTTGNTAVLLVEAGKATSVDKLASQLRSKTPEMSVTFFEAKSNW